MLRQLRTSSAWLEIIVLTYNNLENTKQCLSDIFSHTSNFGLTIFDNHSTDGTREFLKEFAEGKDNITLCMATHNFGIISGRNMAYEMTTLIPHAAEYICFLDNDQFVQDGWTSDYYHFLMKNDIVGFEAWEMRKDMYPAKRVIGGTYHYVGCGGMMLKNNVISHIGLFDTQFNPMFFEDPDFCIRAAKAGYKIVVNPNPLIIHKPHRLLGDNNERSRYFHSSWKKFKMKWEYKDLPILPN